MLNVPWLPELDIMHFPPADNALNDPDGLLLIGGNLSATTLQRAYRQGVFPWFDDEQPIMWWSPSIRAVIPTDAIHISKNMGKLWRSGRYRVAIDTAFASVIDACSAREQTWITDEMREAYEQLHQQGLAHSIEVFDDEDNLVGGLYGVFVRNCFCGESMFSRQANTSKLALIALAKFLQAHDCPLIDCQMPTEHLSSMGAVEMARADFVAELTAMADNHLLTNRRWTDLWQP